MRVAAASLATGTRPPAGQDDVGAIGKGVERGCENGGGTLELLEGVVYVGDFADGKANGRGEFSFPDGGHYAGEIRDNQAHGQGTRTALFS